jgi:serine/threonine-protein kinase
MKVCFCSILFSGAVLATPAFAESNSGNKAQAETLFQEATALMEERRYPEACRKLEASQELDAGIGTLLYLADCYEHEGKNASAWATFREARSQAEAAGQLERQRIAEVREKAIAARLSYVTVTVEPVSGQVVRLGGTKLPPASLGVPIPVDPGFERLLVTAPGRVPYSKELVVPSSPTRLSVKVPRLHEEGSSSSFQRTSGYASLGAGVLGLLGGGVFGLMARDKNDASLDECEPDDDNACSAEGVELRDEAQTFATASTVSFAAGGALALTGLVLVLSAPEDKPGQEIVLSPKVRASAAALELRGRF